MIIPKSAIEIISNTDGGITQKKRKQLPDVTWNDGGLNIYLHFMALFQY